MKKFLTTILILAMIASLAACGAEKTPEVEAEPAPEAVEPEAPEVEEPTPAEPEVEEPAPAEPEVEELAPAEPEVEEPSPEPAAINIQLGEAIETDAFKMTLDSVEIVTEYEYKTGEYSSMAIYIEDGYKALMLKGNFENLGTKVISSDCFLNAVTVNDEFTVAGFDVRFNFQRDKYFEIDPYTDMDYILYINIPEKLADMYETSEFSIAFNDDMSNIPVAYDTDGNIISEADNVYVLKHSA